MTTAPSNVLADPPELWKALPGFSFYDVSSRGRIRSYNTVGQNKTRRATPRMMTTFQRPDGYVQAKLTDDEGQSQTMKVHRLVLLAFIGKPQDGWEGSHMNSQPDDNRVENLAWELPVANTRRQAPAGHHVNKSRGEAHHSTPLTAADVQAMRAEYARGGCSHRSLARRHRISHAAIGQIIRRKTWRHVSP